MDKNYLEVLKMRLLWCEDHYDGRHKIAAIKNIIWSYGFLVTGKDPREKHRADYIASQNINSYQKKNSKTIVHNSASCRIAMISSGGMGDHLLFANHVYMFYQKYSEACDIDLDVVFKDKFGLSSHIFREGDIIRRILDHESYKEHVGNYDLVIDMAGFPKIEKINREILAENFREIYEYALKCEEYREYCRSAFRGNAYGMSKLCELEGRKLIQRGDIYSLIEITEEYKYPLFIDENEDEYLNSVGLKRENFITIQTGIDVIYNTHVKQWPIEHYKRLLEMINEAYPTLKVAQVGNSGEVCSKESDCFINLVDKTNLEQAKVLIKNSLIHIDIEGGMVHLRHALKGGPSIVLFGPTSIEFFGYSDNCNIRSTACNEPCYQMTSCWPERCPRYDSNRCMKEIPPDTVFKEFEKIYGGFLRQKR